MIRPLDGSVPLLDCEVARERAAVAVGRRAVACWLDAVGADADRGADVVTVASELLTMGVLYGAGASMTVTGASFARDVYVEVATLAPVDPNLHAELGEAEWGLRSLSIVQRLSDAMSVRERGDQSLVCCRFDLSHPTRLDATTRPLH